MFLYLSMDQDYNFPMKMSLFACLAAIPFAVSIHARNWKRQEFYALVHHIS